MYVGILTFSNLLYTCISATQGILSGGRTIHLSGNNLNIGNMEYAVTLTNVDLVKSQVPLECTLLVCRLISRLI